jgi:hypothetical protein
VDLASPVQVSAGLLSRLLAQQGLGELHIALRPLPVWRDDDGPDVRTELGRDVLRILSSPDSAFFGWLTHHGVTTSVLSAAIGQEALLAVKRGDAVLVRSISARRLVPELVSLLPDVPPGRGHPNHRSPSAIGSGELYAGRRAPLCYVDTLDGRYVVARNHGDSVRVVPASIGALAADLDGLRLGA